MSSLYISDDTLQYTSPIQLANTLWADTDWIAEEAFNGLRTLITSYPKNNTLFVAKKCCNGYGLGKSLTNNLQHLKELSLYEKLGDCALDCVLIHDHKEYLLPLFDMGSLGADNLNYEHGPFKVVLIDILKFKGVDIRNEPWKVRRVYLEDAYRKINSPCVLLAEAVNMGKREFFEQISASGSKGVVLKHTEAVYKPGYTREFLEVRSNSRQSKNVTIQEGFKFAPVMGGQKSTGSFDFDTYLAMQTLDQPHNIKKLLDS